MFAGLLASDKDKQIAKYNKNLCYKPYAHNQLCDTDRYT